MWILYKFVRFYYQHSQLNDFREIFTIFVNCHFKCDKKNENISNARIVEECLFMNIITRHACIQYTTLITHFPIGNFTEVINVTVMCHEVMRHISVAANERSYFVQLSLKSVLISTQFNWCHHWSNFQDMQTKSHRRHFSWKVVTTSGAKISIEYHRFSKQN